MTDPLRLPNVRLPSVSLGKRDPAGWGRSDAARITRASPLTLRLSEHEPAGEPPPWWQQRHPAGTKPEWSVYWALVMLGKKEGIDFHYVAAVVGVGAGYYSTVDFRLPLDDLAFEVQGLYWHYGQGSDKQFHDIQRLQNFAAHGIKLIFIDEDDAIRDPIGITSDALLGIDRSRLSMRT